MAAASAMSAPAVVPNTSFVNILSNASIVQTDPVTGATLSAANSNATLYPDYGNSVIFCPFTGTSSGDLTALVVKNCFAFNVQGGCPVVEQYVQCIRGFQAAVAVLGQYASARNLFVNYVYNPLSATYQVIVAQLK